MIWAMSALPPKADIRGYGGHVRFVPMTFISRGSHRMKKTANCEAVYALHLQRYR